ncbi:hypothetical protein V8C34DRAFT_113796 [Trichoderma compactum]
MKQQSNPSKCSINAIGYCARLFSGAFISPSRTREIHSPRHSVLLDGKCRSTAFRLSPTSASDQKKIQSLKADCNMLVLETRTAQVRHFTTPPLFPSLPAFLVATHITEVEGAASVSRPLTNQRYYRGHDGSPQESNTAERDCQKPRRHMEHRKRASVSSAKMNSVR